jgi:hypothetical protein
MSELSFTCTLPFGSTYFLTQKGEAAHARDGWGCMIAQMNPTHSLAIAVMATVEVSLSRSRPKSAYLIRLFFALEHNRDRKGIEVVIDSNISYFYAAPPFLSFFSWVCYATPGAARFILSRARV